MISPTDLLCIVGLLAIAFVTGWEIGRIESTGPDHVPAIGDELTPLERDLAEHGSFGRTFADRELG